MSFAQKRDEIMYHISVLDTHLRCLERFRSGLEVYAKRKRDVVAEMLLDADDSALFLELERQQMMDFPSVECLCDSVAAAIDVINEKRRALCDLQAALTAELERLSSVPPPDTMRVCEDVASTVRGERGLILAAAMPDVCALCPRSALRGVLRPFATDAELDAALGLPGAVAGQRSILSFLERNGGE